MNTTLETIIGIRLRAEALEAPTHLRVYFQQGDSRPLWWRAVRPNTLDNDVSRLIDMVADGFDIAHVAEMTD